MPSETQILLFSDIPDEGELIEKLLREVSGAEQVQVASDEKAALDLLTKQKFELIFARSQRGALASTEFLNEVWRINPKSTRFLLADAAPESEALVRCALGAHQVITAPVNPEKVAAALERATAIKRFVKSERIQTLVSRMRTLPSRPSLYVELMRELRSINASAATVGELVSKDLAISTKLIQVANSAYFGSEQAVSEPATAVLQLGLETTGALVLSIEAFARFDKVKPLYFSIDKVWKHSQAVADLARKICQTVGCDAEISAQAYTSGLLHDIGKLALAQNFEEDYQRTIKESEARALPIYEVEQLVFGGTHADTGAYLLAVWGLPLPIVEAVADHHQPAAQLNAHFSAGTALHLAEQLAGSPERFDEILESYPPQLGLAPFHDELQSLIQPEGETAEKRSTPARAAKPAPVKTTPAAPKPAPTLKLATANEDKTARKNSRIPIIPIAIAAVVLLSAVIVLLFSRGGSQPSAVPAVQPGPVAAQRPQLKPEQKPTERVAKPAEPQTAAVPSTANLKLQAIMFNAEKSSLIINGQLFHRGDSVEGWRIISITQKQVVLENGDTRQTLSL